jgi:hypothetical protein
VAQEKIRERDLSGFKYLKRIVPLLQRLHHIGCERDRAGNRHLHFDEYCLLILLYFFNPICHSLRGLQQASTLKKVQRLLGCERTSLGSLSESIAIFEPELLGEIVKELIQELPSLPHDSRLDQLVHELTVQDGSILKVLPQMVNHIDRGKKGGNGWRLHANYRVLKGVPSKIEVTDATNSGTANEKAVLRRQLESGCCYIMDGGYEQFSLFNNIVDVQSSYVARIREDRHFESTETRPLTEAAIAAGVLEDAVGNLGSEKSRRIEHPNHRVRRIRIKGLPHPKRNRVQVNDLILVTNLLDVPAEIIGLIFLHRWWIELFFRFLKHVLGCRHLLSNEPRGIEIQTYCAIIVCLLISYCTGKKPTLRTYEMVCYFFAGWADEDELQAHIEKLKPHPNLAI